MNVDQNQAWDLDGGGYGSYQPNQQNEEEELCFIYNPPKDENGEIITNTMFIKKFIEDQKYNLCGTKKEAYKSQNQGGYFGFFKKEETEEEKNAREQKEAKEKAAFLKAQKLKYENMNDHIIPREVMLLFMEYVDFIRVHYVLDHDLKKQMEDPKTKKMVYVQNYDNMEKWKF